VAVGSHDILGFDGVVPGGDDHIGLPVCRLYWMLVLCVVDFTEAARSG
jgi:hypothetical protein